MIVGGPSVVGRTDDGLLDVDEAGGLQQLACAVVVSNGSIYPSCGILEVVVPLGEVAVLRERAVVAAGLEVDLNVLYPPGPGLEVAGGVSISHAGEGGRGGMHT